MLFLLAVPAFAIAEKEPTYEYVITLSGIDDMGEMKLVYQTLLALDPDMTIGHRDDLGLVRFKSYGRFFEHEVTDGLEALGLTITDYQASTAGQQSVSPGN